jgi:hypothetical protein
MHEGDKRDLVIELGVRNWHTGRVVGYLHAMGTMNNI